ncbi:MAG: hypothetical protein ACNI3A_09255 [Desulfovibrio sp.]|uniref:hypothetical protein n=1 Tax=Desulfovibrio sp. 7SRBS1 TaxID=3378064 RepID=UPI003B3EA6DD
MRIFFLLAVLTATLCLGGCFTKTVEAQNYQQAVAEFGKPMSCNTRPDGLKYCSWLRHRINELDYTYRLFMVFDRNDELVRTYTKSVVK